MEEKNRTLTYSEQAAFNAVLKLIELEMIPRRAWDACGMGKVVAHSEARSKEYHEKCQIKERDVAFQWKRSKIGAIPYEELTLKMYLRAEVPLLDTGKEMQDEFTQADWYVQSIEILERTISSAGEPATRHEQSSKLFEITGKEYIRFLLASNKSRWESLMSRY